MYYKRSGHTIMSFSCPGSRCLWCSQGRFRTPSIRLLPRGLATASAAAPKRSKNSQTSHSSSSGFRVLHSVDSNGRVRSRSTFREDLRRAHLKREFVITEDPNDAWTMLPPDRLGNDPFVNWALCQEKVSPVNDAFRNLHLRHILHYARGVPDETKSIHEKSSEMPNLMVVGKDLSNDTYKLIGRRVRCD